MTDTKRVIVTGATGLIGKPLCKRLRERGYTVVAFSRSPDKARNKVEAAEYVAWKPEENGQWSAAVDGAYAVINLAAAGLYDKRWTEKFKREIRESRVIGTRGLVEAIGRAKQRPKALINASAVGIYGPRGLERVDESASLGNDFLANVCKDWEAEATRAERYGARVVLLRSGVVLEPSEGALRQLMLPYKFFVGGPILPGNQWLSWIHIDDQIGIILRALEDDQIRGPLNAVAPNAQTNAAFARTLGKVMGRPSLFPVPGFAVRLIVGEVASTVTTGQYVVPKKALDHGYQFRFSDSEAALRDLLKGTVNG